MERGCSNPARTTTATTAKPIASGSRSLLRKLQASPSQISCASSTGPRDHGRSVFIPQAQRISTAPYARKNRLVVSPIASRSLSRLAASVMPNRKVKMPSMSVSPAAAARGAGVPWREYGDLVVGSGSGPPSRGLGWASLTGESLFRQGL